MWQTLAKIAIPIILDKGVDYLTKKDNPQPVANVPSQQSGQTLSTGLIQYDGSGLNNQRFLDQSPGWEYRTGGAWQSPSGDSRGVYNQVQSGYSTVSSPNLPISHQNIPNQKPGIYNDLARPVLRETGNQLARETAGYFKSGETGPLLDLLGQGATYLAGML